MNLCYVGRNEWLLMIRITAVGVRLLTPESVYLFALNSADFLRRYLFQSTELKPRLSVFTPLSHADLHWHSLCPKPFLKQDNYESRAQP